MPTSPTLPPLLRQPTQAETLSVVGETIRILADAASTGGACAIFEETSPPGGGPPLHRHSRDDEHFYIIEGTIKFSIDGKESLVDPGGYVFAPRGAIHTFVNAGPSRSRMIIICTPAGLEVPFRECDRLAKEGKETPEAIMAAFRKFDLEFHGPPLKP